MFQLTLWSIPPLIAALVCVGAYVRIQNKYNVPGVSAVLMLLAAVMFWIRTLRPAKCDAVH